MTLCQMTMAKPNHVVSGNDKVPMTNTNLHDMMTISTSLVYYHATTPLTTYITFLFHRKIGLMRSIAWRFANRDHWLVGRTIIDQHHRMLSTQAPSPVRNGVSSIPMVVLVGSLSIYICSTIFFMTLHPFRQPLSLVLLSFFALLFGLSFRMDPTLTPQDVDALHSFLNLISA